MRDTFQLENLYQEKHPLNGQIKIIGKAPDEKPYVVIILSNNVQLFVKDKDLKLFAKNILKALGEKQ